MQQLFIGTKPCGVIAGESGVCNREIGGCGGGTINIGVDWVEIVYAGNDCGGSVGNKGSKGGGVGIVIIDCGIGKQKQLGGSGGFSLIFLSNKLAFGICDCFVLVFIWKFFWIPGIINGSGNWFSIIFFNASLFAASKSLISFISLAGIGKFFNPKIIKFKL